MPVRGQRGLVFPARVDGRSDRLTNLLVVGPGLSLTVRAAEERRFAARAPLPVAVFAAPFTRVGEVLHGADYSFL